MNCLSQVYRRACRKIELPPAEKALFMRLLREISVNSIQRQKAWNIKEDFITLWFISIGRFPELAGNKLIINWMIKHLPFELSEHEINL